eukprot:4854078-Prymnesium_polylepis.2
MPARTVVFTSLTKWDGETFRPPTAAEYTQMAGCACTAERHPPLNAPPTAECHPPPHATQR